MLRYINRREFGQGLLMAGLGGSAAAAGPAARGGPFEGLRLEPRAGVRIDIDDNGIPHIEAQSVEDAFFGQGYAAAFMRLWQLDLESRRMKGRLAEVFGAEFLPHDHAARLMLSRTDPAQDWRLLGERVRTVAEAFVAGVNRRIQEVHDDPTLAAPEFALFDMLPAPWALDDLVRVRYCGSPNVQAELRRALLHQQGALHLEPLAQKIEPAHELTVPAGLPLGWFAPGQLELLERMSGPLPFAKAWKTAQIAAIESHLGADDADQGSNAWVIAGRLTDTGRPILANDPHLAFGIPGPRMVTHLSAPGFNVIGAGPVWRPGVQFGHNEHIAFGRTDFRIDQQDLYVLELDEVGQAYRGPEGWVAIERVQQQVAVAGGAAPATIELAYAAMGPIVFEDKSARKALALRAVWLQPGTCVNLEYVPKLFATDWASFRAALRAAVWGTNYMYADRQGNIGWQSAGRVPVRAAHDGLLPVPASGGYAWTGILPLDDMPHEFNPERGWIGSANQQPQAPNWPANGRTISFEWTADDRYRRLAQMLGQLNAPGAAKTGLEQEWRRQEDLLSVRAVALTAALRQASQASQASRARPGAAPAAEPAQLALQALLAWDGTLAADSSAALLYEAWWSALQQLVRVHLVPEPLRKLIPLMHPHAVTDWVAAQLRGEPAGLAAGWRLIEPTLAEAWERVRALPRRGDAPLTWGDVHRVDLRHTLARWLEPRFGPALHAEGGRSGGDAGTVNARWYAAFDRPRVTGGASFRAVVDLGDWERAMAINLPGQSGDPRSPWYRNLYDRWVAGTPIPLPFERAHVRARSVRQIQLEPRPAGGPTTQETPR